MLKQWLGLTVCSALALALVPKAVADDVTALQAEIDTLKSEMAQLQEAKHDTWLSERRAEELKGLIREVMSDTETRATLLSDGMLAGHDGGHFVLKSADGNFRMQVGGQVQVRGIWDFQDDRADTDDQGLQIRRMKVSFGGHVTSPRWTYYIRIAGLPQNGDAGFQDVIVGYELSDNMWIRAGKFTLPFLREELTDSSQQLAVERSSVNEFFTLNRSEQVQVETHGDSFRLVGGINDGANGDFTTAGADSVELALGGRLDVRVAGEWSQMDDFTAWQGEDSAVFLGAAVNKQWGDDQNGGQADYLTWTLDGSVETNGLGISGSVTGGHIDDSTAADRDMYGYLIQASYNINDKIEPYIRWEYIDQDVAGESEPQILTVGFNYYFSGHNAKWTTDLVYIFDGDDPTANPFGADPFGTDLGISGFGSADDEELLLLRTQFQLLF